MKKHWSNVAALCVVAASVGFAIGFNPATVAVGSVTLFFFVGFVRGHFDPPSTRVSCYGNAAIPTSI